MKGNFLPLIVNNNILGILYVNTNNDLDFSLSRGKLIVTFSGIISTILERYRLMEEYAYIAGLRESERLKSILFSSLSHNLKNPIVSLKATMSSLKQEDINWNPQVLREHLTYMDEDINRLNENIENLLNLAQLESGTWKPKQEWYDLREIISIAIGQLTEKEYNRVQIQLPDEFFLIWVDSVQMAQVIRHLLENALDYSPPSSPVIISASSDNRGVKLWVDDCGPGIPADEREEVFQKFYNKQLQGSKYSKRTGLGLAICKEIVQVHQGNIRVESSDSGGARLIVTLPSQRPA
jgi:two-component system sensor histidine kinase KdpD